MTLPAALDTTRVHGVAGHIGERTALVTTRPFRVPHHTISNAGLIGGGQVPMPGRCRGSTTAYAYWMSGRSAAGLFSTCRASRLRSTLSDYNLPHVIDLVPLAVLAARIQASPAPPT
jgi:hypothetical protein